MELTTLVLFKASTSTPSWIIPPRLSRWPTIRTPQRNYNLTKDTQIIYVDTSADNVEDICVNGGSIENASPAPEGKYYRNASFVIDSGSDLAFLIVITNTDGAYPGSIKK